MNTTCIVICRRLPDGRDVDDIEVAVEVDVYHGTNNHDDPTTAEVIGDQVGRVTQDVVLDEEIIYREGALLGLNDKETKEAEEQAFEESCEPPEPDYNSYYDED